MILDCTNSHNLISEHIPSNKRNWYSWIPTNIGYLNFNYIAEEKSLKSIFGEHSVGIVHSNDNEKSVYLQNTNLSDINCIVKELFDVNEIISTADIHFTNIVNFNPTLNRNQPSNIKGQIKFIYGNKPNLFLQIKSNFNIQRNGKIRIYDISIDRNSELVNPMNLSSNNSVLNTIVNAIYTIVKKIVHGDNHHYQKIDTLIGVYTKFVPEQIITDLGFQIKRLDKFVKNDEQDSIQVLYETDKLNSIDIAEGFHSYIKTFKELFLPNSDQTSENNKNYNTDSSTYFITYDSIVNTIKSIQSGVNKLKLQTERKKHAFVFSVSILALFSTLNIFISTALQAKHVESNLLNKFATFLTYEEFILSARDIITIIVFILVFTITFGGIFIDFLNNKLREKMKKSSKYYSFFEILILYSYINKKDLRNTSNEINMANLNSLEKYIQIQYKLIVTFSLLCFSLLSGIIINSIWLYGFSLCVFFYIGYLIFQSAIKINCHKKK